MPAGAITLADISSADWSLMLDSTAGGGAGSGLGSVVQGVNDVNQCVLIILTTPKGADPLRPTFGVDLWQYIDAPMNAAIPQIVREVTEAITLWEPRIELLKVVTTPVTNGTTQTGAHLTVAAIWRLKLSTITGALQNASQAQTTTVTLPAGA